MSDLELQTYTIAACADAAAAATPAITAPTATIALIADH
jgi:hypothetical protein